MTNPQSKNALWIIVIVLVALAAWGILNMPDRRTTGERVGDAIDALPQGVGKAARELEPRTPGEKLGDAVKDVGEDIKENTDQN